MQRNIMIQMEEGKGDAIALLRRKADRAQQQEGLARAQRFEEGADFLEHDQLPSWVRRPSEGGR